MCELIIQLISPHGLAASIVALARLHTHGSDRRGALERHLQQARYEAERAFAQYDQVDPNNRLIAEVLEQRCNAKLAQQQQLERELRELCETTAALSAADDAAIRALGEDFASVWNDAACSMTLKKQIARTLIKEILVDLDALTNRQECRLGRTQCARRMAHTDVRHQSR